MKNTETPQDARHTARYAIEWADTAQTVGAYLAASKASRHAEFRTANDKVRAHYIRETERMDAALEAVAA